MIVLDWLKCKYYKFRHGYDDLDLMDLDRTIARFVVPRLKRYKELTDVHPVDEKITDMEDWQEVLDRMIWSLERVEREDLGGSGEKEEVLKERDGLELFGEYFTKLWY
jgi:hypothetical protein